MRQLCLLIGFLTIGCANQRSDPSHSNESENESESASPEDTPGPDLGVPNLGGPDLGCDCNTIEVVAPCVMNYQAQPPPDPIDDTSDTPDTWTLGSQTFDDEFGYPMVQQNAIDTICGPAITDPTDPNFGTYQQCLGTALSLETTVGRVLFGLIGDGASFNFNGKLKVGGVLNGSLTVYGVKLATRLRGGILGNLKFSESLDLNAQQKADFKKALSQWNGMGAVPWPLNCQLKFVISLDGGVWGAGEAQVGADLQVPLFGGLALVGGTAEFEATIGATINLNAAIGPQSTMKTIHADLAQQSTALIKTELTKDVADQKQEIKDKVTAQGISDQVYEMAKNTTAGGAAIKLAPNKVKQKADKIGADIKTDFDNNVDTNTTADKIDSASTASAAFISAKGSLK